MAQAVNVTIVKFDPCNLSEHEAVKVMEEGGIPEMKYDQFLDEFTACQYANIAINRKGWQLVELYTVDVKTVGDTITYTMRVERIRR
ncbi:hypothetical protein LPJ61_004929 [Coemansia biformis]|uniref:Uncharacterized protein n=1 Tax=Coemansia biformis TaxID=1286918 RepID=A0A9W7Y9A6_9FUNG|nr:hypothetical protein LPJ61_004929 [Coemansia biformis]